MTDRQRRHLWGRLLCKVGLHSWDYYGCEWSHAPSPIRCERCRILY